MQKSLKALQARRELDRKFATVEISEIRTRPRAGWVRAIRGALGMSQAALALRLRVSPAAVAQLEEAERRGGVTINRLSEVARALDCELLYALVPRTTLNDTVLAQARKIAADRLGYVESTMNLEDQALGEERQHDATDLFSSDLIREGSIWKSA
jgi:predicted DNA-binding mobile mystery protein A